jgi:hypothetical protein
MEMSTWVIISWIAVFIITGINIFVFLKLKGATEQMMKMAFPNAKNMNDAMGQMQGMFGQMQARGRGKGKGRGASPFGAGASRGGGGRMGGGMKAAPPGTDPKQLKAAMEMLKDMKKQKKAK